MCTTIITTKFYSISIPKPQCIPLLHYEILTTQTSLAKKKKKKKKQKKKKKKTIKRATRGDFMRTKVKIRAIFEKGSGVGTKAMSKLAPCYQKLNLDVTST